MGHLVKLFDEEAILHALVEEAAALIHATTCLPAIRKLLDTHDVLSLTQDLLNRYPGQFYWHLPAVNELDRLNRELAIYHRADFTPTRRIDDFNAKLQKLLTAARREAKRQELAAAVGLIAG